MRFSHLFFFTLFGATFAFLAPLHAGAEADASFFAPLDVFELEWAEDPQLSPGGEHVVYRRAGFDIQSDSRRGDPWLIDTEPARQRKRIGSSTSGSAQ